MSEAPPSAAAGLLRVLERADDPAALLGGLDAAELRRALWLTSVPGAPTEALLAAPADLRAAARGPAPLDPGEDDLDRLRSQRRRVSLHLAARELAGELEAPQAARTLSDLADDLLDRALRGAQAEVGADAPALCVLALGKLGGRELNHSSDVDLVLVRADEAPRAAAEAVGRAFVQRVQRASATGRLYRVDLRLRPYGQSGELCPRARAVVDYFGGRGRTWERQAWIKARPVAGARDLGAALLEALAPRLWREQLDARAIQELRALRARTVALTHEAERDLKRGPGGLRDVEFAVQFLQLLHGGRCPALRTPTTLEAIDRLAAQELLAPEEAAALRETYTFLRRLEHLLQLTSDREQTRLPAHAPALAACLGLAAEELEARFRAAQARARELLERLLHRPFAAAAPHQLDLTDLLLASAPDERAAAALLARYGLADPAAGWRQLLALADESRSLLGSGRARAVLAGLAPRLLEAVAVRPEPDRVLRNLGLILAPLGAKATVLQLLVESSDLTDLLVHLAAASSVLVNLLAHHPGAFDEVVDRLLTRAPLDAAEVEAAARRALAGEARGDALRELRALYLLQVAIPDLAGRRNLQNTARGLADLAEGLLRALVSAAAADAAAARGGAPPDGALAVFALGALGARELSYASDCDLVFVYEGVAPAADGAPPGAFWAEVAQRVLALGEGTTGAAEGPLLAVDLRLRPGGSKGPLASARAALRDYLRGQGPGEAARDFERLAWQKARPVAGDPELGAALARELADELYARDYDRGALLAEVAEMRARQRAAAEAGDLKRGPGGLASIELVASALGLLHGGRVPALRQPNTAHLLDALEAAGLLTPARHRELRTAYGFLRRAVLRLRARDWQARPVLPPPGPARRGLALDLGYVDVGETPAEEHLVRELDFLRESVTRWEEETLGSG
ncbi:MAG: DUF294 nucleotidyltransferase-like domain-containing protein [Planctomycetota bacterium]